MLQTSAIVAQNPQQFVGKDQGASPWLSMTTDHQAPDERQKPAVPDTWCAPQSGTVTKSKHIALVRRFLQLTLAVLLVYTLTDPAARELNALTWRLFLRIPGEHTVVRGEPGGVLFVVPGVHFTDEYHRWLYDCASSSPDAYLLASHSVSRRPACPPVERWKSSPYVGWAACKLASNATSSASSHLEYEPEDVPLPAELQQQIKDAVTLVHQAQALEPTNGALWLAEANLCFVQGQRDAGLAALHDAAVRPDWDYGIKADLRAIDAVQAEGIPLVDVLSALWTVSPPIQLRRHANEALLALMTEAVNQNNDAQFEELATLIRDLQRADRRMPEVRNPLFELPSTGSGGELLDAMAQRLGIAIPVNEFETRRERAALSPRVYSRFLHAKLPEQLAKELLQARADEESKLERGSYASGHYAAVKASIGGLLSLELLACFLAGLLLELPFMLRPKSFLLTTVSLRTHRWGFWCVLLLATAGATIAFFSAHYAILKPVGVRCCTNDALLTPFQEILLSAAGIALLWSIARVMVEGHRVLPFLYNSGLWLIGIAYCAAVAYGGLAREHTVQVIYETILGIPPA